MEALVAAFPGLYGDRVLICLLILAAITAANLWGAADSARLFIAPTVIFIVAIYAVIIGGLVRSHPAVALAHHLPATTETVGILLLLRAFASGCSALTGVEAIANAVPSFRRPRARRAQHTEMWLGILLGTMLLGLAILIRKYQVTPTSTQTVLAELTAASLGHNFVFYAIQMITTVLLALAANTSFGGLPVLASLLATDNFLPHLFFLRADRQVHRYGIGVLAAAAAVLLVVPLLVLMFSRINVAYRRIGRALRLGETPPQPRRLRSLVVVPVGALSRLTEEGISAALSLGDEVRAVTVSYTDQADEEAEAAFRDRWQHWHPDVPLITLVSRHRGLGPPIVAYLRELEHDERYRRLVVLIPEVQSARPWLRLLFNQRGAVLDRAIRQGTTDVVICRLRFRLSALAGQPEGGGGDLG